MAIVSISEAARLVGKNRSTLQRHIASGKISKATDASGNQGIDTSELIRFYGFIGDAVQQCDTDALQHDASLKNIELQQLKLQLSQQKEMYEKQISMQQDHIDTLKQAMLLLEHKKQKNEKAVNWLSRFFNR